VDNNDNSTKTANNSAQIQKHIQKNARKLLGSLVDKVGKEITLSGFIKAMTGEDILDDIRPELLRYLGSYMESGKPISLILKPVLSL